MGGIIIVNLYLQRINQEAWRRQQAAPIPTHIESLQGSVPAQEAGFVREQDPWAREQDRPQA